MRRAQRDAVPLGVECAWPEVRTATPARRGPGLRLWLALAVFVAGALAASPRSEALWREAGARLAPWIAPALATLAPAPRPPDRGGERASRG